MLSISSLYYSILGLFSSPKANGKTYCSQEQEVLALPMFDDYSNGSSSETNGDVQKSTDTLPPFDPTSFTEARHLPELNRLRQEELLRTSFTATIPRENYELREQMFLRRMTEKIAGMDNWELRNFVASQEYEDRIRCMGAAELVNRGDKNAWFVFIWCIITDTDYTLRKICVIGLGELGRKENLPVLENIREDDWVYDDAQDAIKKILSHETSITVL